MADDMRVCASCGHPNQSATGELKSYPGKEGVYCVTCRDFFDERGDRFQL